MKIDGDLRVYEKGGRPYAPKVCSKRTPSKGLAASGDKERNEKTTDVGAPP
jgi:hypothetical protein